MIFKTIDGLFKGMKIGVLALAVAGIFGSVIGSVLLLVLFISKLVRFLH